MPEEKTRHRPLKDWVPDEAIEHARAARREMRKSLEAVLPPKYVEHAHAARKEALLAFRSLINAAIDHLEAHVE